MRWVSNSIEQSDQLIRRRHARIGLLDRKSWDRKSSFSTVQESPVLSPTGNLLFDPRIRLRKNWPQAVLYAMFLEVETWR